MESALGFQEFADGLVILLVLAVLQELSPGCLVLGKTLHRRIVHELRDQALDLNKVIERDQAVRSNLNGSELFDSGFVLGPQVVVKHGRQSLIVLMAVAVVLLRHLLRDLLVRFPNALDGWVFIQFKVVDRPL